MSLPSSMNVNLRTAAANRETVKIDGGLFSPAECREAADWLDAYPALLSTAEALRDLVEWAREHTSPRDPNSPHRLLVQASDALSRLPPAVRARLSEDLPAESPRP